MARFELIQTSPQTIAADLAVIQAARTSVVGTMRGAEKDRRLLEYLYRHEHTSPFEAVDFLFRVEAEHESELVNLYRLFLDNRYRVTTAYGPHPEPDDHAQALLFFVRVDLNNAIRIVRLHPEHPVSCFLVKTIQEKAPWTAAAMGLEQDGTVFYSDAAPDLGLRHPFSHTTNAWISLQSCPTDAQVAAIMRDLYPAAQQHISDDASLLRLVMGDGNNLTALGLFPVHFAVRAPVVVWWQLVRHRTASFSLQSGRYVEFQEDDFFQPDVWRLQSKDNKQGSVEATDENGQRVASHLLEYIQELAYGYYATLVEQGNIGKEQARFVLPAWTSLYIGHIKFDLAMFTRFLRLRLDEHAQYETRLYAQAMFEMWEKQMPLTAAVVKEREFRGC